MTGRARLCGRLLRVGLRIGIRDWSWRGEPGLGGRVGARRGIGRHDRGVDRSLSGSGLVDPVRGDTAHVEVDEGAVGVVADAYAGERVQVVSQDVVGDAFDVEVDSFAVVVMGVGRVSVGGWRAESADDVQGSSTEVVADLGEDGQEPKVGGVGFAGGVGHHQAVDVLAGVGQGTTSSVDEPSAPRDSAPHDVQDAWLGRPTGEGLGWSGSVFGVGRAGAFALGDGPGIRGERNDDTGTGFDVGGTGQAIGVEDGVDGGAIALGDTGEGLARGDDVGGFRAGGGGVGWGGGLAGTRLFRRRRVAVRDDEALTGA